MRKRIWYPLDNAANIYPVTQNSSWTSMFRYTVLLDAPVDKPVMQRALDSMRRRFPGFYVRLKAGLFWYYLEECDQSAQVEDDCVYICARPPDGGLLFRVLCYNDRVSAEFSHIICDGGGGLVFFKTLLAQYFRELGLEVPCTEGILNIAEHSQPEEWEDAFLRYARPGRRPARREGLAFHPVGLTLTGMQCVTTGSLSVAAVLGLARKHRVSLTEYLTATLMYVLYRMQLSERVRNLRPVKVSVPVNLRKYYKTRTLRNFSQYFNPGIDPQLGDFTFEETLEQVHHYFHYMFTEKNLNARMSQNVDAQKNVVMRIFPLFLKRAGLKLVYETVGERVFSSVISNVGAITFPEAVAAHIRRVDLMLHTALHNPVECGIASFDDVLSITFTRTIAEPFVERMFFRLLVQQGLHVTIESNMT